MKGLSYVFARIRNKKVDTTILLVVLILSNSLFTSYYFYSRNSADVVLHQKLSEIPYHAVVDISSYYVWKWFNYTLPLTDVLEYIDQNYSFIDTVAYIRSLPVITNLTIKDPKTSELTNMTDYVSLTAITSNFTDSKFSDLIDTSVPISQLNESEVLVDSLFEDYAQRTLSISLIGKKLYVHHYYTYKNYTTEVYYIVGTFTVTHEELEERYRYYSEYYFPSDYYSEYYFPSESKFGMFISTQAALNRLFTENETLDNCNSKIFITFKSSFFSADRLEYVESELRKFKNKLTLDFQPFVYVSLYVTNAISEVRWWTTGRLISTFQAAFPVLVTAWVVLKFEFELSGIRRRREIATLKSRGYSNLNIISLAIVEMLIYALLSLPIILPFSNVLSFLLLQYSGVIKSFDLINAVITAYDPTLLILVFSISFALLFFSYIGLLLYVMSVETVETRVYTSTELDDVKVTGVDLMSLFFVIPGIFAVIISISFVLFSETGLFIFLGLLLLLGIIATYILLKIGAVIGSRLKEFLLKYFTKYQKQGVIFKLLPSYTHYRRKMDGYSIITIFLVLLIATTSVITIATVSTRIHDVSYYYAGSDLSFRLTTTNLTMSQILLNETKNIEGVKSASLVRTGVAKYTVLVYGTPETLKYNIYAIDDNFLSTAFIKDYFLRKSLIQTVLAQKSGILMTKPFKFGPESTLPSTVELKISTGLTTPPLYKHFDVLGEIEYMPRLSSDTDTRRSILMTFDTYTELTNYSAGDYIFVRLNPNANLPKVLSTITAKLQDNITKIRVAENYIEKINSYIENKAYFGLLYLTLFLMLLFVAIGQEVLFFDKYEKMRKDIAVLKAIGMDSQQVRKFVLTDLFVNLCIAFLLTFGLIGFLYVTGNLANRFAIYSSVNFGELAEVDLPFVVIIPFEWIGAILGVVIISFIISLIPILRMLKRLNVAQEMKYEFG